MLSARRLPPIRCGGRVGDGVAGLVGGAMGGIGGLTGPAPILWCMLHGWDHDTQRAVFQSFNISMHTLTITVYIGLGLIDRQRDAPRLCIDRPRPVDSDIDRRAALSTLQRAGVWPIGFVGLLFSGIMLLIGSVPQLIAR
jgi:uncharacterized protein